MLPARILLVFSRPLHPWYVRRVYHGGLHDRHYNVLHTERAGCSRFLLVWVASINGYLSVLPLHREVSMNGVGLWPFFWSPSQILTRVAAIIVSGFISFGALHIHAAGLEPWQW